MKKDILIELKDFEEVIKIKDDYIYELEGEKITLTVKNQAFRQINDRLNLELKDLKEVVEEFSDRIVELEEENKRLIISNYLLNDVLNCTKIVINIKEEEV